MAKTERQDEWLELRSRGLSMAKIQKRIGVSKTTQVRWEKKFQEDLKRLRAEELEAAVDRHMLAKKHRIQRFAALLDGIEFELSQRDLSEIPTDRLFRIYLSAADAVRQELEPFEVQVQFGPGMQNYLDIIKRCGVFVETAVGDADALTG